MNLILDGYGSAKLDGKHLELRHAGVKISIFRPVRWHNVHKLNNRMHRRILHAKVLLVDRCWASVGSGNFDSPLARPGPRGCSSGVRHGTATAAVALCAIDWPEQQSEISSEGSIERPCFGGIIRQNQFVAPDPGGVHCVDEAVGRSE